MDMTHSLKITTGVNSHRIYQEVKRNTKLHMFYSIHLMPLNFMPSKFTWDFFVMTKEYLNQLKKNRPDHYLGKSFPFTDSLTLNTFLKIMKIQLTLQDYTLGYHEPHCPLSVCPEDDIAYSGCNVWNNKHLKYTHTHI